MTLARENLGYTELHSDVDGIVTAVYAEAGQVVAAGQHVLRVAEPREREAVFDVPEVAFRLVPHDPEVDGQLFVDGGIINNFPASVMASMLRGPVVGVDVTSDWKLEAQAVDIEDKSLLWLLRKGRKEARTRRVAKRRPGWRDCSPRRWTRQPEKRRDRRLCRLARRTRQLPLAELATAKRSTWIRANKRKAKLKAKHRRQRARATG